jgi:2-oxoacid:acceptor oxidoreductase gamma subunit (pyruvate/2-ketoisovalerate family)
MLMKVIFWGRGGEGAKTAGHILAEAAFSENKEVQAFPEYGPERSGAPMRSYVKISDEKIKDQSSITIADYIIFIDGALIKQSSLENEIFKNADKNTKFIINAKNSEAVVKENVEYTTLNVDASEISLRNLGKDYANVVLLSVLVKLTGIVKLESLENAVKDTLKGKPDMVEKNLNALKDAYTKVNNW